MPPKSKKTKDAKPKAQDEASDNNADLINQPQLKIPRNIYIGAPTAHALSYTPVSDEAGSSMIYKRVETDIDYWTETKYIWECENELNWKAMIKLLRVHNWKESPYSRLKYSMKIGTKPVTGLQWSLATKAKEIKNLKALTIIPYESGRNYDLSLFECIGLELSRYFGNLTSLTLNFNRFAITENLFELFLSPIIRQLTNLKELTILASWRPALTCTSVNRAVSQICRYLLRLQTLTLGFPNKKTLLQNISCIEADMNNLKTSIKYSKTKVKHLTLVSEKMNLEKNWLGPPLATQIAKAFTNVEYLSLEFLSYMILTTGNFYSIFSEIASSLPSLKGLSLGFENCHNVSQKQLKTTFDEICQLFPALEKLFLRFAMYGVTFEELNKMKAFVKKKLLSLQDIQLSFNVIGNKYH